VFRKISDVKREEEETLRRQNEAPLDLPPDHPVRRLFQRFRQQREARLAGGGERVALGAVQNAVAADVEKGVAPPEAPRRPKILASTSIVTVTESPATPAATPTPSGPSSRVMLHANVTPVGCKSAEPHKARGWGRLRDSVAKAESWGGVSKAESMETLPGRTKRPGETPLKKTDSCDSGITKSDLRLDGDEEEEEEEEEKTAPSARASFLELKQDLRGDIRALDGRMAALEAQLAQMLRLLEARRSSGSFLQASGPPSPDSHKGGFS